jgi:hypothetical protein
MKLLGPGEVREMFGVAAASVSRWQRDGTLPDPDWVLLMGPVWTQATIEAWARETGRRPLKPWKWYQ